MIEDFLSHVSASVEVAPSEAFAVLENPVSFRQLVAGARKVRRFDSRWPEVGTRLHHTVGVPPLLLRDHTEVVAHEAPHLLVLDALIRPFGRLRVEFGFAPSPEGTLMTVTEWPEDGPLSWPLVRILTLVGLHLRNREICRRFKKLAARRSRPSGE